MTENKNTNISPLISARGVKKYFNVKKGLLKAVDNVSFDIYPGETFGLVGESGCGKSTTGRTITRLLNPTGGEMFFDGEDLFKLSESKLRKKRRDFQFIFQDPYASLNPRMTVESLVEEPMLINGLYKNDAERREKVIELLNLVGLSEEHASRFPHEFSGGQRQRVGIARALALNPKFIVCDEPISALDVSIQAQVINILIELQKKMNLTYLFIAHDLSMVRYISDRVGVMYLGNMMEVATSDELYSNPIHPYTIALKSAIPLADPNLQRSRKRIMLEGEVPSPIDPPNCCPFVDRCPRAQAICRESKPELKERNEGHFVACHLV
ncbi:oligopeptide transport system ATP-binding protein [Peptoniphilus asaccharolyticus DSM 20463]|uniref:Oligopeptide transport system ATP-binding protein n=1 Tax=Peptoniphilus asaccharolyticus DSM 20463 TaxID=573058 RepID=A0A1W1V0F2_PEPAS|nr:oligopeptide/dipeptide ABC transporter ATP-binding protein [Peptoniphilus asaccharolyticus]MBL7575455.1 ATP-binding cassette domain-containing protein [Peptoniphilus asaccharolyticus]SMB86822.1 oligopeptide transport system ATP-binding protein [Peptoniphilus asaccharolyticus DSM 20463]